MAERLGKRFGEMPIAAAPTAAGALLELYATRDRATWTIVLTSTSGVSCVMASGEGWRWLDEVEWPLQKGERAS